MMPDHIMLRLDRAGFKHIHGRSFRYWEKNAKGDGLGVMQITIFDGRIILEELLTLEHSRRQGVGKRMLQRLVDFSDRNEIPIRLKVLPLCKSKRGMTAPQLKRFYAAHGFEGLHNRVGHRAAS